MNGGMEPMTVKTLISVRTHLEALSVFVRLAIHRMDSVQILMSVQKSKSQLQPKLHRFTRQLYLFVSWWVHSRSSLWWLRVFKGSLWWVVAPNLTSNAKGIVWKDYQQENKKEHSSYSWLAFSYICLKLSISKLIIISIKLPRFKKYKRNMASK